MGIDPRGPRFAAAICSADSVQSISPPPARLGKWTREAARLAQSGYPTGSGMAGFGRKYRNDQR